MVFRKKCSDFRRTYLTCSDTETFGKKSNSLVIPGRTYAYRSRRKANGRKMTTVSHLGGDGWK